RISGDGRVVVFQSMATNLVAGDTNGVADLFARDRTCGNGVMEGIEQCDDGANVGGDGCDANCTVTACGHGQVSAAGACDTGADTGTAGCCSASCTLAEAAGDGVCDAAGPCVAPGIVGGKLAVTGLAAVASGIDKLVFKGRIPVSPPLVPPLDPM